MPLAPQAHEVVRRRHRDSSQLVKRMSEKPIVVDDSSPMPTKKPYVAPVVVSWGTLRDMTQKVGKNGHADGAGGAKSKTKP